MKILLLFFIIFFLGARSSEGTAEAMRYFQKARRFAVSGELDFAFMNYKAALQEDLKGKFASRALFAMGEYAFCQGMKDKAREYFRRYLRTEDAESNGRLFALAYLLRMARDTEDRAEAREIAIRILSLKRQGFLFQDQKVYRYKSPLRRDHEAVYTIDEIDIFIEGDAFEKIAYGHLD